MKITNLIIVIVCLVSVRCNSDLENPDNVSPDNLLDLQTDVKTLRYAAMDTTTITASVPKDAGMLDVKFTATHGMFVASGSNTVNDYCDTLIENRRYAYVLFTSDSSVSEVFITAEVPNFRKRISIEILK